MRHYSYRTLYQQRVVVAGLTLGLLAVIVGVSFELYLSTQRTTIPSTVSRLTTPLDPLIDVSVVEKLETYRLVTQPEARGRVQQSLEETPVAPLTEPAEGEALTPAELETLATNPTPEPVVEAPAEGSEAPAPLGEPEAE